MKNNKLKIAFQICLTVLIFINPSIILSGQTERAAEERFNTSHSEYSGKELVEISGRAYWNPGSNYFAKLELHFFGDNDVDEIVEIGKNGKFSYDVESGWSGTVTPVVCDPAYYSFSPAQLIFTNITADSPGNNIYATVDPVTISGTITEKFTGVPLANTEINFQVSNNYGNYSLVYSINTNALGQYNFNVVPCWSNTVDPYVDTEDVGYYYFENTDGPHQFYREYDPLFNDTPNQDYTYIDYGKTLPPGWDYTTTGTAAFISVETTAAPDICGDVLELGDLIGVFYYDDNSELQCGGYGLWQDESNTSISAIGDDTGSGGTPEKDGFGYAEAYKWRVYSYKYQKEFFPDIVISSGYNKWYSFGLTVISGLEAEFDNDITIPAGWSGISSYTLPSGTSNITTVMNPIYSDLVILQDMTSMYYPAIGVNTIGIWNGKKGYKIKVTEETVLPLPGCPDSDKTINLTATWNIIPVLSLCNVLLTDVFDPIVDKIIVIKEIGGNKIFWPEAGIQTLQILESGKAYYVAVTQNTSITFQECTSFKSTPNPATIQDVNLTPWQSPAITGSNHSIAFTPESLIHLNEGDFIGAFTSEGICAGLTQVTNLGENLPLSVFGDDVSTTAKDGFAEAEYLNFKIFNTQSEEEINVAPNFDGNYWSADCRYTDNGLSVVKSMDITSAGMAFVPDLIHF